MDKIMGIVRHVLTFVGGLLVALGVTSSVDWSSVMTNFDAITGAVVAIVGVIGSIVAKVSGDGGIGAFIKNLFTKGSGA